MQNSIFNVIQNDLCVGCGACLYRNQESELKMGWNREGFLIPTSENKQYLVSNDSIKVCPFNPFPDKDVRTEDELAKIFLNDTPNIHPKVGKYYNTYVGYSEQFRLTSSSGGIATYILSELFDKNIIDAVITVGEGEGNHYKYKLIKNKEELLSTSKTKYYPVTMADTLNELERYNGKVAIVGIGCFIKAIRLLQYYNPELKEKIVFTIGIICGGLKSKFFAEYLAAKAGINNNEFIKPQFRIKDYDSNAGDYSFGCIDKKGNEKLLKMRKVGDMWGTGMFKCNACDFCDDVTTELADISLGDAWIHPYNKDGKGTNVIVTRSILSDNLIKEGIQSKKLNIKELPFETFLSSQQGSYNHRHKGLLFRIKVAKKKGCQIPPKRFSNQHINIDFKIVQRIRLKLRRESLKLWMKNRNSLDFDSKIQPLIKKLKLATRVNHIFRRIQKLLNK